MTGAPDGDVSYYTVIENGKIIENKLGSDEQAEFTMTQSYDDAVKVLKGELDANAAFMQGRVKVTGNMGKLMSLMPLTQSPSTRRSRPTSPPRPSSEPPGGRTGGAFGGPGPQEPAAHSGALEVAEGLVADQVDAGVVERARAGVPSVSRAWSSTRLLQSGAKARSSGVSTAGCSEDLGDAGRRSAQRCRSMACGRRRAA